MGYATKCEHFIPILQYRRDTIIIAGDGKATCSKSNSSAVALCNWRAIRSSGNWSSPNGSGVITSMASRMCLKAVVHLATAAVYAIEAWQGTAQHMKCYPVLTATGVVD